MQVPECLLIEAQVMFDFLAVLLTFFHKVSIQMGSG